MNKIQLIQHAETCQQSADEMAYLLMEANKLAAIQSVCNFNIFWLSDISPIICRPVVIDFICDNTQNFKRKLSVKEFLMADLIISNYLPETFNQFKIMFTNYRKEPELFNNMKKKVLNEN